jgi:hypothetical protein
MIREKFSWNFVIVFTINKQKHVRTAAIGYPVERSSTKDAHE